MLIRMRGREPGLRVARLGAVALGVIALVATGCSSSQKPASNVRIKGGSVTYMFLAPSASFIWPFVPGVQDTTANIQQFQWLMYRPLYLFGNDGTSTAVNYPLSTADPPVYSDAGKTVVINLKGWKWSDGETVDARDVMFWLNMMKAEKDNYAGYVPGLMPDNLVSYQMTGPLQVTLHLNRGYSVSWFTYNQLSEITPMPLAWDVTSLAGAPGSGGCATSVAKCPAVWKFLTAQAMDYKTYTTSKLWSVVDGPWRLAAFSLLHGPDTFVPNPAYSGSPKPSIAKFSLVTKNSDKVIFDAEKSGQASMGRVATSALAQLKPGQILPKVNPLGPRFKWQQFWQYSIYFYIPNYTNPVIGPVFRQLYVRQALEYALDQPGIISKVWKGYAIPGTGPLPNAPANPWISAAMRANGGNGLYPFSLAKASALLASHGWRDVGGVQTCQRPGTGPSDCGAGIPAGRRLTFTIDWVIGNSGTPKAFGIYAADAAKIGIKISLAGKTLLQMFTQDLPCKAGAKCAWTALSYGFWIFNGPGYEPTGEALFQTGADGNQGGYSNAVMNKLIDLTHTSSSMAAFDRYANYAAAQLPFIWLPHQYAVWEVNARLHDVVLNPLDTTLPEYYYYTK